VILLAAIVAASPFSLNPDDWKAQMRTAAMPSLAIAGIRDETVVTEQTFGTPAKPVYQIGFLSRLPALISLFQLVDAKKVSLDQPVNRYLKTVKVPKPDFPGTRDVRVRDLLLGQSGYDVYKFPGGSESLSELLAAYKPVSAPGEKVARSAMNEAILQQVLVDVDGASYVDIIQKRIFAPLKLTSTFATQPEAGAFATSGMKPQTYPALAAQGLWSSAGDVARLLAEVMRGASGESKLVSKASGKMMLTELREGATHGLNRDGTGDVFLGGHDEGYTGMFKLRPQDGTAVVVLTSSNFGWPVITPVIEAQFAKLSQIQPGESTASFEPRWATGVYAGKDICPVCEYGLLPMAFVWVQNLSDDEIITAAQAMQAKMTADPKTRLKPFVVFSNLAGNLAATVTKAKELAARANTPNVPFVVVKDPLAGTLRSFYIDRQSKSVFFTADKRSVKTVISNPDWTKKESTAQVSLAIDSMLAAK
jgi:hypothetical protein